MAQKTLADLSETMRDIDFCMLVTRTDGGQVAARPMSNNRDVAYTGDSHFFTFEDTRTVSDIAADPKVLISLQGKAGLTGILGAPPMFLAVQGTAELIRDKATFEKHWDPGLERWFTQGTDTPGLVLVRVRAERIRYWDGEDEGEILV